MLQSMTLDFIGSQGEQILDRCIKNNRTAKSSESTNVTLRNDYY